MNRDGSCSHPQNAPASVSTSGGVCAKKDPGSLVR
nr:MAG TPA: hypothetical protein [Caudoviricetes sp.]